jgi:DedD protein
MCAAPVNLRNLEQIHEVSGSGAPRLSAFLLAGVGLAAVVVAGLLVAERSSGDDPAEVDPLEALVRAETNSKGTGEGVRAEDLTFPEVLSDAENPTTALVALRGEDGKLAVQTPPAEAPPAQVEGLPTEPRPLGSLLGATKVTTEPKDQLTELAVRSSAAPAPALPTPSGSEGGFLIQVASFKEEADAEALVQELKTRGHRAFRQTANVPGRGIWHRVRIGSFQSQYEATLYKTKLEETERMATLVIDPDKVERQEQTRALKLAESIRKYGSP